MTSNHPPRPSLERHWIVITILTMAAISCDSRWFDMQRTRQAAVERTRPAELQAAPSETLSPDNRLAPKVEIRVYVSPRYSTELLDWRNQLDTTLEYANRLLEPSLNVRLAIQEVRSWKPEEGGPDLQKALTDLTEIDRAPDRVWVLGLVGSVPRAAISIHELGVANIMGNHMVLRNMNDAREYDAIQQQLHGASEQERHAIYHERKRHKMAAVLLHEFAHTLGVPHELAQKTMMNPTYDAKVEGYSNEVLGAMRISLQHRLQGDSSQNGAFAQKLTQHVEQTASTWVPSDRDELLGRLRSMGGAARDPRTTSPRIAELSEAENAMFADVHNDLEAKRLLDAFNKGQPLFSRYPNVYKVQELRCQIAMARGGVWNEIQKECEPLMRMTDEMIEGKKK